MKTFRLTSLALATAAVLGVSAPAQADAYSYAISYDNVFDLQVSSSPFIPVANFSSFSTTSGADATLNGSGVTTSQTAGGPADSQPAAGTGSTSTRTNNDFTPIGIAVGGNYSTSDAQVSATELRQSAGGPVTVSNPYTPTQAWNIAESLLTSSGYVSEANGKNSSVTGFSFTVDLTASTQFSFNFKADPYMYVALGADAAPGSQAFAALTVGFTITPANSTIPVFIWAPDGQAGGILGGLENLDPYNLNLSVSVDAAGTSSTYDPTNDASLNQINPAFFGLYSATTNAIAPGRYTVNIDMKERTTNQLYTVPEPGTLTLLGLGLAGFGWSSRRRKAA